VCCDYEMPAARLVTVGLPVDMKCNEIWKALLKAKLSIKVKNDMLSHERTSFLSSSFR
jgi:hypothetical protein